VSTTDLKTAFSISRFGMKVLIAFLIYFLVPALVVFLCMRSGNWWGLFAVLTYFAGVLMAMFRQWIFFPIPLVFTFWFWYTYGFSPTHFVSLLFLSLLAGAGIFEGFRQLRRFFFKVLPEQMTNLEYNDKVDELNRRLELYRRDHPNKPLTPDIVEKIRTDIFFQ
jgi:hypothetical protein